MADNNLARSRNDGPDFFAENDPLAELARIVGYDERLVPKPPVVAERREPAFNLEDELLREFERYEAPRPLQSTPVAANVSVAPQFEDTTPFGELAEASAERIEVAPADAVVPAAVEADAAFIEEASPRAEPAFAELPPVVTSGEDAFDDYFADGAYSAQPETGFVDAPVEPAASAEGEEWLDAFAAEVDPADASAESVSTVEPVSAADVAPALDLSDELELALAPMDVPRQEPPRAERKAIYTPGFRMPLANFHATGGAAPRAEPAFEAAPAPELAAVDRYAQPGGSAQDDFALPAEAAGVSEPAAEVFPDGPAVEASLRELSLDEPSSSAVEDLSSFDATALDAPAFTHSQPASAGPRISEPRWDLPFEMKEDPFSGGSSPLDGKPAAAPAHHAPAEPILDDEFELALDDLELDLTDILSDEELSGFAEPKPVANFAPAPAPQPAPAHQPAAVSIPAAAPAVSAAPVEQPRFTASWSPVARFVPNPAPAAAVVSAAAAVDPVADVSLAEPAPGLVFDPAQIADTDDQPEPVIELEVPELQFDEPEPVYRNDYDYDIDAELASLLQPVGAEAAEAAEAGDAPEAGSSQPNPHAAGSYPDLDDFERALEEDFRRSLTTPLPPQPETGHFANRSGGRGAEGSRRSMAAFAVPLAVAGVVLVGGSVAYAIFGGDSATVASNGEPIVIAADTDPVKVLPENPGGKTVPNQDKAVYDRVAGQVPDAPKQEALISTSEEPVDVVQKTLMTDQLPLEGEGAAGAAAEDPYREDRLMPETAEAMQPVETAQQPLTVMPRRVKTMIVRPDGTLVEQEVAAAPEPTLSQEAPVDTQKVPAASVRSVEVATSPETAAAAPAGAAPETNSGIVPVSADVSALAETAGVSAPAVQSAVAAPVPTARPARQPVDVVAAVSERGNVTAAPQAPAASTPAAASPAPAEPTLVASVAPGGYVIQIASLPTAADAEKSYKNLSAKFASVIGGRGVDIREAEIAGKGTFYRVRIPAGSKADAVALCESYRAAGGSCLVAR